MFKSLKKSAADKKIKKEITAPAVVHGNSPQEFNNFFKEQADGVMRKYAGGKVGKGDNRRVENIKAISENWDNINWK
jgi:hypothetical protein